MQKTSSLLRLYTESISIISQLFYEILDHEYSIPLNQISWGPRTFPPPPPSPHDRCAWKRLYYEVILFAIDLVWHHTLCTITAEDPRPGVHALSGLAIVWRWLVLINSLPAKETVNSNSYMKRDIQWIVYSKLYLSMYNSPKTLTFGRRKKTTVYIWCYRFKLIHEMRWYVKQMHTNLLCESNRHSWWIKYTWFNDANSNTMFKLSRHRHALMKSYTMAQISNKKLFTHQLSEGLSDTFIGGKSFHTF